MNINFKEDNSMRTKQEKIERRFQIWKQKLDSLLKQKQWDASLALLSAIAEGEYVYNQFYRDDELEERLLFLARTFRQRHQEAVTPSSVSKADVLFYDAFGKDLRGLAYIYLEALCKAGYRVVYLVPKSRRGHIPQIGRMLKNAGCIVEWYEDEYTEKAFHALLDICLRWQPKTSFLYTKPWDAVGLAVFECLSGRTARYLINLTDHAFWLGVHALDYCLEFRDYGASISRKYRKLMPEQLLMQPYYPVINYETEFQGFPFPKWEGDFVLFSGGSIYKTLDKAGTFYQIVDQCLAKYPFVRFWYAGGGESPEMQRLVQKYPKRAVWTAERSDLFQLLQHVDLYLNTYPISGGLMLQYAALAGKIPLTLLHDEEAKGMLLHEEGLEIYFSDRDSFEHELYHLIEDRPYRARRETDLQKHVLHPVQFRENLCRIIESQESGYDISFYDVDTESFRRSYLEQFNGRKELPRLLAMKSRMELAKVFPMLFLQGALKKLPQKIKKSWRKAGK